MTQPPSRRASMSLPPAAPPPPKPKDEHNVLVAQLYESEERYRRAKSENESLRQKNHHLEGQMTILKNKSKTVSDSYRNMPVYVKSIEKLESDIKILQDKNDLLKSTKDTLYDDWTQEQQKTSDLQAQNESLTEKIKNLESEYSKMSSNYTTELAKESNKYKTLKSEYKNLNKEYMEIRSKLNITAQELNVITLNKNELNDELIISESNCNKLDSENNDLKTQIEKLEQQLAEAREDHKKGLEIAQKKNNQLIKDLRSQLHRENTQSTQMRVELFQLKEELNDLRSRHEKTLQSHQLQQQQILQQQSQLLQKSSNHNKNIISNTSNKSHRNHNSSYNNSRNSQSPRSASQRSLGSPLPSRSHSNGNGNVSNSNFLSSRGGGGSNTYPGANNNHGNNQANMSSNDSDVSLGDINPMPPLLPEEEFSNSNQNGSNQMQQLEHTMQQIKQNMNSWVDKVAKKVSNNYEPIRNAELDSNDDELGLDVHIRSDASNTQNSPRNHQMSSNLSNMSNISHSSQQNLILSPGPESKLHNGHNSNLRKPAPRTAPPRAPGQQSQSQSIQIVSNQNHSNQNQNQMLSQQKSQTPQDSIGSVGTQSSTSSQWEEINSEENSLNESPTVIMSTDVSLATRGHKEVIIALSERLASLREEKEQVVQESELKNKRIKQLKTELSKKNEMIQDLIEKVNNKPPPPPPPPRATSNISNVPNNEAINRAIRMNAQTARMYGNGAALIMNNIVAGSGRPVVMRRHPAPNERYGAGNQSNGRNNLSPTTQTPMTSPNSSNGTIRRAGGAVATNGVNGVNGMKSHGSLRPPVPNLRIQSKLGANVGITRTPHSTPVGRRPAGQGGNAAHAVHTMQNMQNIQNAAQRMINREEDQVLRNLEAQGLSGPLRNRGAANAKTAGANGATQQQMVRAAGAVGGAVGAVAGGGPVGATRQDAQKQMHQQQLQRMQQLQQQRQQGMKKAVGRNERNESNNNNNNNNGVSNGTNSNGTAAGINGINEKVDILRKHMKQAMNDNESLRANCMSLNQELQKQFCDNRYKDAEIRLLRTQLSKMKASKDESRFEYESIEAEVVNSNSSSKSASDNENFDENETEIDVDIDVDDEEEVVVAHFEKNGNDNKVSNGGTITGNERRERRENDDDAAADSFAHEDVRIDPDGI